LLEIVPLILGPVSTNTSLVADSATREAVVIDPAWDGLLIAAAARQRSWHIRQIWITHAHFDHIGGVGELSRELEMAPVIALHPSERVLWDAQGDAALFGLTLPEVPEPTLALIDGMDLCLGQSSVKVLCTPGHTPGHCVFYAADVGVCFCGDLIFQNSVGRTDLPEGDFGKLLTSIRLRVFTLADTTRLLSGHGAETTVGQEKRSNPFVRARRE
jgi:hydroxyacylglutathione hydrolase